MDVPLVGAIGNALALLTSQLQRRGALDMAQFAGLLAIQGSLEMDSRPEESQILLGWAAIIQDVAEGIAERDLSH